MTLQEVFIANMRKFRKRAKLTQEKLAELCNSDPHYIGQIENSRRFPSVTFVEKIAAALKVAPHELFYDENWANASDEKGRDAEIVSGYFEELSDSFQKMVSDIKVRYLEETGKDL
jgi:transcriptional regulator with XRE-family HTH domain